MACYDFVYKIEPTYNFSKTHTIYYESGLTLNCGISQLAERLEKSNEFFEEVYFLVDGIIRKPSFLILGSSEVRIKKNIEAIIFEDFIPRSDEKDELLYYTNHLDDEDLVRYYFNMYSFLEQIKKGDYLIYDARNALLPILKTKYWLMETAGAVRDGEELYIIEVPNFPAFLFTAEKTYFARVNGVANLSYDSPSYFKDANYRIVSFLHNQLMIAKSSGVHYKPPPTVNIDLRNLGSLGSI